MKKVKKPKPIKAKNKKLNTTKMLKHLESYSTIAKNILPMMQYLNQTVSILSHPQIDDHIDNEKKMKKVYSRLKKFDTELDSMGDLLIKTKAKIAQHLMNKEL